MIPAQCCTVEYNITVLFSIITALEVLLCRNVIANLCYIWQSLLRSQMKAKYEFKTKSIFQALKWVFVSPKRPRI
jgi:hypothetical protein